MFFHRVCLQQGHTGGCGLRRAHPLLCDWAIKAVCGRGQSGNGWLDPHGHPQSVRHASAVSPQVRMHNLLVSLHATLQSLSPSGQASRHSLSVGRHGARHNRPSSMQPRAHSPHELLAAADPLNLEARSILGINWHFLYVHARKKKQSMKTFFFANSPQSSSLPSLLQELLCSLRTWRALP